ncbi:hypothetical protein [Chitinophaga skermanii]|nr:hypothetical protein [Chitinophaga skermanii]
MKFAVGNWKTPLKGESNIHAYVLTSDPLNFMQDNSKIPDVNGIRIDVKPVDNASKLNGHSMDSMLKVFGLSHPSDFAK